MLVPGPGLGGEEEAASGVAEALLEEVADVSGDEVGGGGGVAVVEDGEGLGGGVGFEGAEGGEERVEGAGVVDEVGRDRRTGSGRDLTAGDGGRRLRRMPAC